VGVEVEDEGAKRLRKMQQKEAEKSEAKLTVARERLKAMTEGEEALNLQRVKMAKFPAVGGSISTVSSSR